MNSALPQIEDVAARWLVQREPYPVIAPESASVISQIIEVARKTNQKVLVFGSGSSFDEQFTLLRDNVISITTAMLTSRKAEDEFRITLAGGVPLNEVLRQANLYPGRTLSGFICGRLNAPLHELRRRLWSHVESVEIVDGTGAARTLAGAAATNSSFRGSADALPGSEGRLAILTAVTFTGAIPKSLALPEDGTASMNLASAGRAPLSRDDIRGLFDPHSLFAW